MSMTKAHSLVLLTCDGGAVRAEITVKARSARVWQVLTAFEEMPVHLSALERSKVLSKHGAHLLVEQCTTLKTSFLSLTLWSLLDVTAEPPFLYFTQRRGFFRELTGYWHVAPSADGQGSRIVYYLEIGMRKGLRRWWADHQLRQMIQRNMQELAVWVEAVED
jgi:hypothetical protein